MMFCEFLLTYENLQDQEEETHLSVPTVNLMNHDTNRSHFDEDLEMLRFSQRNSMVHIKRWVKGEIF